jgi:hypothetical protein
MGLQSWAPGYPAWSVRTSCPAVTTSPRSRPVAASFIIAAPQFSYRIAHQ